MKKCWWCRRVRETSHCRLKFSRHFIDLCTDCKNGFKQKIMEIEK